jgi:protein TonB
LTSVPITGGSAISGLTGDNNGRVATAEPFTADQVERQVSLRPGSPAPTYPDVLRSEGVEGQVVALFVVNERGRAELGTLRFTRSDNPLFEAAVRDALAKLQFVPAEVAGRKVRQLVQMPFLFRLSR